MSCGVAASVRQGDGLQEERRREKLRNSGHASPCPLYLYSVSRGTASPYYTSIIPLPYLSTSPTPTPLTMPHQPPPPLILYLLYLTHPHPPPPCLTQSTSPVPHLPDSTSTSIIYYTSPTQTSQAPTAHPPNGLTSLLYASLTPTYASPPPPLDDASSTPPLPPPA